MGFLNILFIIFEISNLSFLTFRSEYETLYAIPSDTSEASSIEMFSAVAENAKVADEDYEILKRSVGVAETTKWSFAVSLLRYTVYITSEIVENSSSSFLLDKEKLQMAYVPKTKNIVVRTKDSIGDGVSTKQRDPLEKDTEKTKPEKKVTVTKMCKSCKGTDHSMRTSRKCLNHNAYLEEVKERAAKKPLLKSLEE